MKSKWFELKEKAKKLRKSGKSIVYVEKKLGIPRSTLSGWFKDIILSEEQTDKLRLKKLSSLKKARKIAVKWHNKQKDIRIEIAKKESEHFINKVKNSKGLMILCLSLLYLGEGFKNDTRTGMGNSDPLLLKFFISIMTKVFNIDKNKIGLELHLRADQNPEILKKYWSKQLDVPLKKFTNVSIDKRTYGKPTYKNYKGVCVINCSNVAIQRKLIYIGRKYCEISTQILRD